MTMKDKAKNMLQITRGRAKRAVGTATHDKGLAANGAADERNANLKQAGEKLKDALGRD